MMKLVYEGSGAVIGSGNKVACEVILAEDEVWDMHLESFLHFLNTAGYIIDPCAIPHMVHAAQNVHQDHFRDKRGVVPDWQEVGDAND